MVFKKENVMNIETLEKGRALRDQLEMGKQKLNQIKKEIEGSREYIISQEEGKSGTDCAFRVGGREEPVTLYYKRFGRIFLTCLAVLKAEIQQEVHRLEKEFAELRSE